MLINAPVKEIKLFIVRMSYVISNMHGLDTPALIHIQAWVD